VAPALALTRALAEEIGAVLADEGRGERLRDGLVVAIAGPPNAGKSTLLNRIAKREAAIVSPYAGTTRDVIEVHLDLGGWPVTLLDTAGMREGEDPVEMEGVRRARERAAAADLVLWLVDASEPATGGENPLAAVLAAADAGQKPGRPLVWMLRNKIDVLNQHFRKNETDIIITDKIESENSPNNPLKRIVNKPSTQRNELPSGNNDLRFEISAQTGAGIEPLLTALAAQAERMLAGAESALLTRERHRRALQEALAALQRALALSGREDLLAEELRAAGQALGRLTGRVGVEDVLDVIFRDFCIGK